MNTIITANFRGTEHFAFHGVGGTVFVALRPIVETMGLNWSVQLQRIRRDTVLSKGLSVMKTPSASRGGSQSCVCIRLDLLNGFLCKLKPTRFKPKIREKIEIYQRECYRALNAQFSEKAAKFTQEQQDAEGHLVRLVTECRHTWGITSAQQLWHEIGLPVVPAMRNNVERQLSLDLRDKAA